MASIYKHGTGWQAQVNRKGYPKLTETFSSKKNATNWARNIERDIDAGKALPSHLTDDHTLDEAYRRFVNITLPARARNASQADTKQRLKWWHEQLGRYSLHRITPALVSEYRGKRCLST